MFHSFDYPDETGSGKLQSNFWTPRMIDGVIEFPRPEECRTKKLVGQMAIKEFGVGVNLRDAGAEAAELEI